MVRKIINVINIFKKLLRKLLANIGTFYFGAVAAWSSPSLPFIVENQNYHFWVTKSQFGLIVAAMPLGAMFSSIISGFVRHRYGTKKTILIFAVPATFGSVMVTFSLNLIMVRI